MVFPPTSERQSSLLTWNIRQFALVPIISSRYFWWHLARSCCHPHRWLPALSHFLVVFQRSAAFVMPSTESVRLMVKTSWWCVGSMISTISWPTIYSANKRHTDPCIVWSHIGVEYYVLWFAGHVVNADLVKNVEQWTIPKLATKRLCKGFPSTNLICPAVLQ